MAPKYEQLVMALRQTLPQWYADGQRKLPCEQELAAQFSVSRQTLRQALAVLEQEGLIEKRRGSGSFLCPAAANQDRRIAVIATSLSDYIFPSLLKDIQACLSVQGFSVVIHATENSIHREREILQQLLLDPPAGILVEGCKTALPNPNAELYQALRQRGLPMTFLHGSCRELPGRILRRRRQLRRRLSAGRAPHPERASNNRRDFQIRRCTGAGALSRRGLRDARRRTFPAR